ncbi:MAG TPA: hypothetical protein VMI55_07475 [Thermoplasmata archaeon]|nr:hypothetical protein [Thermoplasmata archaeon]
MTRRAALSEIPASVLERFRAAEPRIEWRPATGGSATPAGTTRIAHLFQEEARVTRRELGGAVELRVDSGPVGALVLLLEVDRRGPPSALGAAGSGRDPAFPSGALVARWGPGEVPTDSRPRLSDLVELARYALP